MAAIVFPLKEKNMLCISLYFLWLHETKIERWDEPFFKVKTRWMLTLSSIKIWFDILPMWYYIIHFFGNQRWEERSSNYIPSSHTSFCILVFCEKKTFNLIFLWLCAVHAKNGQILLAMISNLLLLILYVRKMTTDHLFMMYKITKLIIQWYIHLFMSIRPSPHISITFSKLILIGNK